MPNPELSNETLDAREAYERYPEQKENIDSLIKDYNELNPRRGKNLWRGLRIAGSLAVITGLFTISYENNPIGSSTRANLERMYKPQAVEAGLLAVQIASPLKKSELNPDEEVKSGYGVSVAVLNGSETYDLDAYMFLNKDGKPDPRTTYSIEIQRNECRTPKCPHPEKQIIEMDNVEIHDLVLGHFLDHTVGHLWEGEYYFYPSADKSASIHRNGHLPNPSFLGAEDSTAVREIVENSQYITEQAKIFVDEVKKIGGIVPNGAVG
jgi:hypothetical protein